MCPSAYIPQPTATVPLAAELYNNVISDLESLLKRSHSRERGNLSFSRLCLHEITHWIPAYAE
jgi:hypothetical protein